MEQKPPLTQQDRLARLRTIAQWFDSRWTIAGTNISFGLDSLVGLIPGIGDTITGLMSLWIVREAHLLNIPWHIKIHMLWNIFVDWLVGLVPFFGDIFDVAWKANIKNFHLIEKHLKKHGIV